MDDFELMHHGIKGMKWGVRRYQNKDGSLTNAGKKRYSEDNQSNIVERHKAKLVDTYKSRGYSQEAAETAAKNQMKVSNFLLGGNGDRSSRCYRNKGC